MPREARKSDYVQFALRIPPSLADRLRDMGAKRDIPVSGQQLAIALIERGIGELDGQKNRRRPSSAR